jgi:hypothetical protein
MKHLPDRRAALARRPIGKGRANVRERAPTMVAEQMPSKMAEKDADAAGQTERQTTHHRADDAERPEEDAATPGAMFGKRRAPDAVEDVATLDTLVGKVHAADSMGRLLFSR